MTITRSAEETRAAGSALAKKLSGGEIVCLIGPLGAGKTTFVQGLVKGLGVKKNIQSPTFTLMQVYQIGGRKSEVGSRISKPNAYNPKPNPSIRQFVHVDPYRLDDQEEFFAIGLQDYLGNPETVVAIEWADQLPKILKDLKCIIVKLEHVNEKTRKVTIKL